MFLCRTSILTAVVQGGLVIVPPLPDSAFGPASIDLTLDRLFRTIDVSRTTAIKLGKPIHYTDPVEADEFTIPPWGFVLAQTAETITLGRNMIGFLAGRSSSGRTGLIVENAPNVQPGFSGRLVLELINAAPVPHLLQAGSSVCQISFAWLDGLSGGYAGRYQDQREVEGSLPSST